jgi:hypothetical protein
LVSSAFGCRVSRTSCGLGVAGAPVPGWWGAGAVASRSSWPSTPGSGMPPKPRFRRLRRPHRRRMETRLRQPLLKAASRQPPAPRCDHDGRSVVRARLGGKLPFELFISGRQPGPTTILWRPRSGSARPEQGGRLPPSLRATLQPLPGPSEKPPRRAEDVERCARPPGELAGEGIYGYRMRAHPAMRR